jgi:hypothetical protein
VCVFNSSKLQTQPGTFHPNTSSAFLSWEVCPYRYFYFIRSPYKRMGWGGLSFLLLLLPCCLGPRDVCLNEFSMFFRTL